MIDRRALGWTLLVIAAAVAVYWPVVHMGYFADDYFQIATLEGRMGPHNPAALYSFFVEDPAQVHQHIARGSLPWWTVDDFRFLHLRPLASLLIELDHAIAPRGAALHHVHSLLWLAVLIATVHATLRRATTPSIAAVAVLVFALDETLAWNTAWVANRCAMISATFVFAAMAVHQRRVHAPDPRLWGAELLLWALGFAAGEYAVCGLSYAVAYAALGRSDPWKIRARALIPATIALALFAIGYWITGAGVQGGTSYIDPFGDPTRFFNECVERASRTAGETWLSIPGETEGLWNRYYDTPLPKLFVLWNQDRSTVSLEQAHGRFSFGAMALLLVPTWLLARRLLTVAERRTVGWTALGSLLSLVPLAATPPMTRTLVVAGLGPAVFVGTIVIAATRACSGDHRAVVARVRAAMLSVIALAALVQHVVLDITWSRTHIDQLQRLGLAFENYNHNDATRDLPLAGKHVVVLAAPELVSAFYGQWIMNAVGGPVPKTWHTLAMGPRRYIVRRHGDRGIELSAVGETMHVSLQETLFRTPQQRLSKGDEVDAGLFVATIVQELPWRGPSAIMFRFDRRLDDPSLVFMVSGEHGLEPFALPEPGRSVALPLPQVPHDIELGASHE